VEIDAGIREALAVVIILSRASVNSAYVNYEWAFALGCAIPVIPIVLEALEESLHTPLPGLPSIDFTQQGARPWDSLAESLTGIQDSLRPATVHIPRGAPPAIQRAAQALDSMNRNERQSALASLAKTTHPHVVEILADATRHPIRQVRENAAAALAEMHDARAIPALLEALRTRRDDPVVKPWMLAQIGESAVPQLIAALDHQENDREQIYQALGTIGNPQALKFLLCALRHPNSQIRSLAALALRRAADPSSVPALREALHDPEKAVRGDAMTALVACAEKSGDYQQVLPLLIDSLNGPDAEMVGLAIYAFEKSGDPHVVPHLVRILLTHENDDRRDLAKFVLRGFGSAPAPFLREALSHPEAVVRARALGFLKLVKDESDLPRLIDATRDEDRNVRLAAVEALGDKNARPAVPALLERLHEEDDSEMMQSAVYSLGEIGDPSAVPALIELLKDEYGGVLRAVVMALERIKDPTAVPALIECLQEENEIAGYVADALEAIGTKEARVAVKTWKRRKAN
jgi:HEAT repeat protein